MKRLLLISILFLFVGGCGGGGDGGSPPQTTPKIIDVAIYDEYWNVEYSFTIGEFANFSVDASDPDLDMKSLLVTQYYPSDSQNIYYGPSLLSLPSQSSVEMTYWNIDPIEIIGPAGSWRIEFEIEDSLGHESNIFKVFVSVN